MKCSFPTNDNIYKYISSRGKNLTPYSIAIVQENILFLTPYFKYNNRDKIDYEDSDDLYNYYLSNCEKDSFRELRFKKIHWNYDQNKTLFQINRCCCYWVQLYQPRYKQYIYCCE